MHRRTINSWTISNCKGRWTGALALWLITCGLLAKGVWKSRTQHVDANLQHDTNLQHMKLPAASHFGPTGLVGSSVAGPMQFLSIAMPTAHRPDGSNYLSGALHSLYCALNASAASPYALPPVVVLNADVPSSKHTAFMALSKERLVLDVYQRHGLQLLNQSTLHEQLHAPQFVSMLMDRLSATPEERQRTAQAAAAAIAKGSVLANGTNTTPGLLDAHEVVQTEADPADRLWWRSKEVLDTAYAFEAAMAQAPGARYCLFLQDDILLADDLFPKLQEFLEKQEKANSRVDVITLWTVHPGTAPVERSRIGFEESLVAIAMHSKAVKLWVPFLRRHFPKAPVDWLLRHFVDQYKLSYWAFYPNLVQHVGVNSSLKGKKQPRRSATFQAGMCATQHFGSSL